ncbi:MAG: HAMP domain-containing sensor histidine kinase, partial [Kiritimatiellae bacterium]|nr:HAMP domain-containing sensor histidine kinase [Kiritimatiellia bacterium]
LAPEVPHWEITLYRVGNAPGAVGRALMAFAWLLLALLLAALLGGGLLLLRDAARQRLEATRKTGFVSSVSHELKTPLTSIRMYAELLRDGRVRDEARGRKYLDVIVAESQRLTRLVSNVLDFSRLEQGRRRFAREALDAKTLVTDVAEAQRGRLEAAGLKLRLALPEEPVTVSAERDAVEQVLVNLLDNAAKYAAGGGEVTMEVTASPVGVRIGVLDRGPGVAPQHRKRLFEQFYRADGALTASQTGFGLGLSIARRLMRGMGGELHYEPREGGGSKFVAAFGVEA